MKEEKFEITFTKSAFSPEEQRANLQGRRRYTREVASAQRDVEALDSQDDFRKLLIDRSLYAKDESGFGIKYDKGLHAGGSVILSHQEKAAESFLRDLRGFGLLADVVGSGKTFEAGVILSELAVRGKVKSLMIVTPDQVFNSWVDVVENKFGLGKGVLYKVQKGEGERFPTLDEVLEEVGTKRESGFIRPAKPIIVDVDVFAQWRYTKNLLIDVIVVDEAHHLSEEEGKYTGAMKLLSEMMQTKKRAEATYCLLLSATPHSGNLENMFRLWYFVRCKGGNPSDFEEKDDKERSRRYLEEKKYYKEYICRGASNVMEFIRKVKYLEVKDRYPKEFAKFIAAKSNVSVADMTEYDLTTLADEFLRARGNEEKEDEVLAGVSRAYHNGVLRSIMIRQPNRHMRSGKFVRNYFFYPMHRAVKSVKITGLDERDIEVDFTRISEEGFPLVTTYDGERVPLDKYVADCRGRVPYNQAYAQLLNELIVRFKEHDGAYQEIFTKKNYEIYYADRLRAMPAEVGQGNAFIPVEYSADKLGYKYGYAKNILRKHAASRVLVFFDYGLPKGKSCTDEFVNALKADPEFSGRIIIGAESSDVKKIEREFNAKSNAILVACSEKFTEGANLQASNVIINYQVPPDPLAMDQRIGRIFRLGQTSDVTVYSLADMNELEGFALAYFSQIGLLSSNSGDATILAGSNSDKMVAVRCNACGRVKLMSQADYDDARRNKIKTQSLLTCTAEDRCRDTSIDGRGTVMSEITVYDFKCDSCGTVLTRSVSDGYLCISHVTSGEKGRMCNSGVRGDRAIYCRKICALSHCRLFETDPRLKGKCEAITRYRAKPNVSEAELLAICERCTNRACRPECKISGIGKEQIYACGDCSYAGCSPAPHVLDFDEKWEAYCPMPGCKNHRPRGKLRPIVARTFATFITESWNFAHDGGESFCLNLGKEAEKVSDIRRVLSCDGTEDENG